jgi:2-polyprenyl-6-methoxyphenol hydroxylase-like FAD-dependent oxidoreductase
MTIPNSDDDRKNPGDGPESHAVGPDRTVLVIGSGLSGLATAVGLARLVAEEEAAQVARTSGSSPRAASLNITIEVVEKRSSYSVRGAAFGLAPNGMKALQELCPDVARQLQDEGIRMPQTGGHLLPWYRVRDALLKHTQQQQQQQNAATIRFRMGWNLESIEQIGYEDDGKRGDTGATGTSRGVRAVFTNGQVLEGSILVAADGIHSRVRELLGLPPAMQPPASRVWRGHATVPATSVLYSHLTSGGYMPLGTLVVGRSTVGVFSFHSKTPGTLAWTVTSKEPDIPPGANVLDDVLSPHLVSDDHAPGITAANISSSQSELIREIFRLTDSQSDLTAAYDNTVVELPPGDKGGWGGKGRVVLVGDAAHAMRQATGLGGSMAFEDALLLCRKLRNVWWSNKPPIVGADDDGAADPPRVDLVCDVLRDFENERLPRVRRIWETEWCISEASYAAKHGEEHKLPPIDHEYRAWVFSGI